MPQTPMEGTFEVATWGVFCRRHPFPCEESLEFPACAIFSTQSLRSKRGGLFAVEHQLDFPESTKNITKLAGQVFPPGRSQGRRTEFL